MDFLEGFLMGPVWSDTEYETRRHIGFHLFLGFALSSLLVYLAIKPELAERWLGLPMPLIITLFIFLTLTTPFICRIYYQLHFLLKPLILALLAGKFALVFMAAYQLVLPSVNLEQVTVPENLMEYINDTIAKTTESFAELSKATGMLLGIITGGLLLVLRAALLLIALVLAPVLLLVAVKIVQRGIDLLVQRYILKDVEWEK